MFKGLNLDRPGEAEDGAQAGPRSATISGSSSVWRMPGAAAQT
jgi:hypothetical protein